MQQQRHDVEQQRVQLLEVARQLGELLEQILEIIESRKRTHEVGAARLPERAVATQQRVDGVDGGERAVP